MSERGELDVLLPVKRMPTRTENRQLLQLAFAEARRLAATVDAKVLGLKSVARASTADGRQALRVRFAVDAPESTFHHRKTF